ncbi:MAG: hypothetical protein ACR2NX_10470 [Chthoniobacterales bacterium]
MLSCSRRELEQLLVAASAETITDPAVRARTREMTETMRRLLEDKAPPPRSRLAALAIVLALAALAFSAAQTFYYRQAHTATVETTAEAGDYLRATNRDQDQEDPRIQVTLDEMARRAPSLRGGNLQAWWAGEQARQVQWLEAHAKRQMIVGDREGAVQSVKRADDIRSEINALASFEKPPPP